jgi:hypothetical protein
VATTTGKDPKDMEDDTRHEDEELAIAPQAGAVIPLNQLVSISYHGQLRGGNNWRDALSPFLSNTNELALTDRERHIIERHIAMNNSGLGLNMPLRCRGMTCPFKDTCPYVKAASEAREAGDPNADAKIPFDKSCPIEQDKLISLTAAYADALNITRDDFAQFQMCKELAVIAIYEDRLDYYLADPNYAPLIEEDFAGQTREGQELFKKQASPAVQLKLELATRRSRIYKDMVITREAMVKAASVGEGKRKDMANAVSELSAKITAIEQENIRGPQSQSRRVNRLEDDEG